MKTKSTSQTPRTHTRNVILLAVTALVLSAWPIVALAADCPNKGVTATVTAASVHVWNSGTLTGNSTVSTTNGMTVDGTVAPNGGGGTLTFGGAVQLNGGATTQCKVTPQDPSTTPQVSASAQVSLGGRLSVTMTGDFSSAPMRFTLLYADSVNSLHRTFDSQSITYPTGQGCWVPQITYDYSGGHVHVYLDRVINCN
jgi:hypothetical protein